MTPRSTDWGLALLVGLLFATGVMTLFAGQRADAWIFAVHGAGGFALAAVLGWKLRRVWRRLAEPARWDRRTAAGAAAVTAVAATLLSGVGWSSGAQLSAGGYNLLNWHFALGVVLTLAVAAHALARAKPLRRRDLGRRQFLRAGAVAAGCYLVWELQRPLAAWFGLRGGRRRFTGSYEAGSSAGNAFPSTSWVADSPRPLNEASYRLELRGLVARPLRLPLSEIRAGDRLVATLDCTGGFYSRQRWSGVRLARLLDRAGPLPAASHVREAFRRGRSAPPWYHVQGSQSGGEDMKFKSGDRVQVESESTERPPRTGVVEEVVQGTAYPRYRIRWDDGHESIYTPAAGALHSAEPAEKG